MGCQGSKSASAPALPSKTLLPGSEKAKSPRHCDESASARLATKSYAENSPADASKALGSDISSNGVLTPSTKKSQSQGALRKQRTLCTERKELDIMVTEFVSHDSTVGSAIGRNCKEMSWKVGYDLKADAIDIKLHVQEHKLHNHEVRIESNGQPIFCGAGSHAKAKMIEDFKYEWPFRATIQGINAVNCFEAHPPHLTSDVWYPATISSQRPDGFFEVTALEPDGQGGFVEVKYPALGKSNLRDAATKTLLEVLVPESSLVLEVLKHDPSHAVLSVDDEPVTYHFGRPSPPGSNSDQQVAFQVSKDRSMAKCNVGHGALAHFVSGEVRSVKADVERLTHSWTFQLGPHAEHTVEIAKKYTLGKIVTLLVDGTVLVEATAADIGCASQSDEWHCSFNFIGERILDFEVFKTNKDGSPLDETAHVMERRKYVHECAIRIPNMWDVSTAMLTIDGKSFSELPVKPVSYKEEPLSMEPRALLHSYGITAPYKVDMNAPSNLAVLAKSVLRKAEGSKHNVGALFKCCCPVQSVAEDHSIVIDQESLLA